MRSLILKIGSLLFLLSLNSILLFAQGEKLYNIRNFSKQTYNAENQNWSITRDQNGFVYVANNIGLLVFDGVEWMFYPAPNGTVIRSVAVDDQNRVFTSGFREIGFWERNPSGKLTYNSLNQIAEPLFSKNEEFWNTVIVGGKVYFRSFTSIFIYDYNEFSVVRPGGLISSISKLGGELCLHIYQRGLFLLENDSISEYLTDPVIKNSRVHFAILQDDSALLIGTESNGLFIYKNKRLLPFLEDWKPYFSENKINRGTIAKNGAIVIGTLRDGVSIFKKNGILEYHINKSNGLQNNTVLGIESDEENNIWLSFDQGVDFITFRVDPSYTYYPNEGLGAIYAASLYNEILYLCTNQGVFYRDWMDNKRDFLIIHGTEGQVWNSGEYEGQLIISHNEGSFIVKDTTAEKISNISGGLSIIRHPSKKDMLVQSTYNQIVFYDNSENKWQISYSLPGFSDLIRYIEFDHVNNLWASHMHRGVFQIQLNDSQDSVLASKYFGESVFGKDYDIQVFKIENRIIFTTGKQIFTYNDLNDSIIKYDHLNKQLGDYASSHRIIAGPDHHYWFISKTGIALFRIFKSDVLKIKGYPINLFKEHLIQGYENILPLGPMEGLLTLDNGYAVLRADKPDLSQLIADKNLSLNKIEVRGRTGKSETLAVDRKEIRIPHKKNSLTLSFAFPLFSSDPVLFQYFIEGLDANWSEAFEKPVFDFTRIPFGEYAIKIRAFNEWNITSEVEVISLTVSPPIYLSKISFIIYTLILVMSFAVARHILLLRIRSRERKIKETKEKELIRLRNENLNAELAFKSQELANSTMSIIKKNEFLLELKEIIKNQKEDLGTRFPEKHYLRLIKKIDNNISSMDDWNVFEIHFEKAHEKFLHKLMDRFPQLSHSDLRLCAYLRMNLTSKEIAPLLRISFRGVENHRYKLRKKLNLKKEENLTDFILSI